jgi:hypothetical protein
LIANYVHQALFVFIQDKLFPSNVNPDSLVSTKENLRLYNPVRLDPTVPVLLLQILLIRRCREHIARFYVKRKPIASGVFTPILSTLAMLRQPRYVLLAHFAAKGVRLQMVREFVGQVTIARLILQK